MKSRRCRNRSWAAVTPLSALAVEVLPGPLSGPPGGIGIRADQDLASASTFEQEDPLGANLGLRRILRTLPLKIVPAIC